MANISALAGLHVLVVGLGREGKALAAYLAGHNLQVTATDAQPADKLGEAIASLTEAGVTLVMGEHPLSLLEQTDIIFVSPGIPLEIPFLKEARARKIPLTTETRLFCHLCPAPIVGITGSSGKTTTTTLVGEILRTEAELRQESGRTVWVGGNIGRPLIDVVDQIHPDDRVVMELSSFQLEYFHPHLNQAINPADLPTSDPIGLTALLEGWSPAISAILNITPNHLDRHSDMKYYVRAKRAVIDYQSPAGIMVMGLDDDMSRTLGFHSKDRTRWFSLETQIPGGAALAGDDIVLLDEAGAFTVIAGKSEIKLRGRHNLSNILAACLISHIAGASPTAMRQVVTTFTGVSHRLELVRDFQQVKYYNDSIATSPERLIAALNSFEEPIILLAGGRDKHLPWAKAARLILQKTRHVILFGEATEIIGTALKHAQSELPAKQSAVHRCVNLEEAVHLASVVAHPGDVVLLSPGCASYDSFQDFAERGKQFTDFVQKLEAGMR